MKSKYIFKRLFSTIFLLFVLMIVSNDSSGKSIGSNLEIRTTVPPALKFAIITEPSVLTVTPKDVKKGFTKIKDGIVFSIITNNRNGYILRIRCRTSTAISHIEIIVQKDNPFDLLPGENVGIQMPYEGLDDNIVSISFIVYLKADTEAGEYVWPIFASVHL